MKTLFKIFLVLFVLFLLLVGSGIFILTRPGVQKKLVESQLPEGSSIRTVRVTTSSLELSELKLALPDGTRVRLDSFDTDFKPLDALFEHTMKLGALNVDGLVVEIPTALIQSPAPSDPSVIGPSVPTSRQQGQSDAAAPTQATEAVRAPMDALYAIDQLDWLIDIDSIDIKGELRDAAGSRYAMDLSSGAIRPGEGTTMEASLTLNAGEALHAGLKAFDASARLFLKQNTDGGFEQVRVESLTKASDQSGNNLLSLSQELDVSVQGFEERASLALEFNIDLPRPGIFLPELSGVGPLNIQGDLAAGAERDALTLRATDLLLSAAGKELVSVKLNKHFTLGGEQDLSGNLMDLRVTNLPLAWLAPWLPQGLSLVGDDLSAEFNLTGQAGGALELSPIEPLRIGPISLSQDGAALLNQVTILAQPVIGLAADQSMFWDLNEFQILDRYGEVLSGESTGRFAPSASPEGLLPAGLQTQTKLDIGLQEITQQPALAAYTSILRGRASVDLKLDPAEKHAVQVQGRMDGLSPRAYPNQQKDYRFALQLNEPKSGLLALGANLQAGSENSLSSDLQLAGQFRPGSAPTEFKLELTAERMSQRDLKFLSAALQSKRQAVPGDSFGGSISPPTPSSPKSNSGGAPAPTGAADAAGPPWGGYDGELDLSIAEFVLLSGETISDVKAKVSVTEPLLSLNQLGALLPSGQISGEGEARYSKRQRMAYAIRSDLSFENVDPAVFSKKPSSAFPVQGLFDGRAQLSGQGETLDQALDAIEGEVIVTGREGVLTAFELDNRSNLGLIGAGLLGDRLNRPGISALAKTVPYFENMPFSDFTLKLNRRSDNRIMIPELRFVGRNVLIDGSGSIAASSLKEAMSQPLDLTLEIGAKGQLVDYLETLNLLGSNTAEGGFRRWDKAIQIGGTLSDPDTSALERILKNAANRALTQSGKKEKEAPAGDDEATSEQNLQPKPSKEERILRDVESGLNLLFGQ